MIATCLGLRSSVSGIPPGFEAQARAWSHRCSTILAGGVGEPHQPVKLALRLSEFESHARNENPGRHPSLKGRPGTY